MSKFIERFDEIAGISQEKLFPKTLERIVFGFVILMFLCEPHSIAATQIAWLLGMTVWIVRLFIRPRPSFFKLRSILRCSYFSAGHSSQRFFPTRPTSRSTVCAERRFCSFSFMLSIVYERNAPLFYSL